MLLDKIAIIYGAGGSIGSIVAETFAREGAKVFLTGHSKSNVDKVAKGLMLMVALPRRRKLMLLTRKRWNSTSKWL